MSVQKKRPRQFCVRPGRTRAWWDNFLNGVVVPEEWKGNFRMCKENFVELCNELRRHIQKKTTTMWSAVDVETQVALTLYYLADEGRLRRTACVFGPIISTVSIIIHRVARVLTVHLGSKYMQLPLPPEQVEEKVSGFYCLFFVPQCFGAVDCTHIDIKQPRRKSTDYVNRKS